jgi:hypothetical protein
MKAIIKINNGMPSGDFPEISEEHTITLLHVSDDGSGSGGGGNVNAGKWTDLISEGALTATGITAGGSITFNSFLVKKIDDCILIFISALFSITAAGVTNGWSVQYGVDNDIFDFGVTFGGGVVMSTQGNQLLRLDYGDGSIGITYISGEATAGKLGVALIFKCAVPYLAKIKDDGIIVKPL